MDQDRNQVISHDEFYISMMQHDIRGIESAFYEADINKDQLLSLNEAEVFEVSDDEYYKADSDNSGKIELKEFANAFIQHAFIDIDTNQDGEISYQELVAADQTDN